MCVILPAMREDRWLVPEDQANRQQDAVVPFFVEIARYLGKYVNKLRIHIWIWFKNVYCKIRFAK